MARKPDLKARATAQKSLRSYFVGASSPVARFTLRRGSRVVLMGFFATRANTGAPVVMPPSIPPLRLLVRSNVPSSRLTMSSWT